jgi:hypothetical protein
MISRDRGDAADQRGRAGGRRGVSESAERPLHDGKRTIGLRRRVQRDRIVGDAAVGAELWLGDRADAVDRAQPGAVGGEGGGIERPLAFAG